MPWLIVLLLGAMTGVAGGALRDVLCDDIPLILRRDLYATAALAGCGAYMLFKAIDLPDLPAALLAMAVIVVLRFAAILYDLRLPVFRLRQD